MRCFLMINLLSKTAHMFRASEKQVVKIVMFYEIAQKKADNCRRLYPICAKLLHLPSPCIQQISQINRQKTANLCL